MYMHLTAAHPSVSALGHLLELHTVHRLASWDHGIIILATSNAMQME